MSYLPPTTYIPPPSASAVGYAAPVFSNGPACPSPQGSLSGAYAIDAVVQGTNPELLQWFRAVDRNEDGTIDVNELNSALSSAGTSFSISTTEKLFRMFDTERNGYITFKEFEGLHRFVKVMQQRFIQRDVAKKGRLTGPEVRMALYEGGYSLSEETFQQLMRKFDSRKSGSLGFDDYIELSMYISKVRDVFAFYDQQRTGQVLFNFDTFVAGTLCTL